MSEAQNNRETIIAFTGLAKDGNAWLQAAWLDSQIEITVSEKQGADVSVVLSEVQAQDLVRSLFLALWTVDLPAPPSHPQTSAKCTFPGCNAFATCHVTEIDSESGGAKIIDLCEQHAHQHCNRVRPQPPDA